MTNSVPTVYLPQVDESLIIASSVGALIAIVLIISILFHVTYQIYKQLENSNNGKKIQFVQTKVGKRIMAATYVALILYLLSCISMAFIRSNAIVGDSYDPYKNCNIGWILVYHGNSAAKTIIYSIFICRLYISFKHSSFAVPKLQLIIVLSIVWIILAFLIISTATIIGVQSPLISGITPNGIIFCGTPDTWPPLFRECVILILLSDILFNFYILYAFISRLRQIRMKWTDALFEESKTQKSRDSSIGLHLPSPKSSSIGIPKSQLSKSQLSSTNIAEANDKQSAKKILRLSRLMMKLTLLVLIAVFSSWIAWGLATFYTLASLLYTYDIIINSLCLWLLLSTSESIWKKFVTIFYFPCCCFYLCPSLKKVDEIDGVTKVIEIKTQKSVSNVDQ